MNLHFKKLLPHLLAILSFIVVCSVYFAPQLQGEVTVQGDIVSSRAMSGELKEYEEKTGDIYYWNNGMFAGMPWRLLSYSKELNINRYFTKVFQLWFGRPIGYFLGGMICCYLCLILLGVNPWLSATCSIAFALNTNFLVLWEAGHTNKVLVILHFPLILGGMLLTFRKKLLLGGALFALGLSLTIYHNHIQMVYYLALLLGMFYLVYFTLTLKEKGLYNLLKVTAILIICGLLAAASNSGQLYSSRSYAADTMRGAPILKDQEPREAASSSSEVDGLEWNYAMNWSNGLTDLFSIIVPRAVGGSSGEEVSGDTEAGRLFKQSGAPAGSDGTYQAPMYFGPLPFTSGPYYLGAVVLLLFVLGLMELKPALRWGIISAFLFCMLLSLGKHASWLNRPLFEYLPLFNKFRSPNSIMNVIPLLVAVPAFLGLQRFLKNPDKRIRKLYIATGITGGLCLILALLGPGLFDFSAPGDVRYPADVREVFVNTRKSLLQSDAFRSLGFIMLSFGLLWAYIKEIIRKNWLVYAGLGLVVLIDLWGVGKRYLDADNFVPKNQYEQNFAPRPVDQQIKAQEPKGRGYYRVFDQSINTFNSSMTSEHHNTIGGYHPAKLQRYQDLIDYYISQGNPAVLNMLNTKYIISPQGQPSTNPAALGNAWFVDSLLKVNTPREEIEALGRINTGTTAIVLSSDFLDPLSGFMPGSGQGSIALVEYEPDNLVYQSSSSEENLAVFSEIWYGPNKGWSATIDGKKTPIIRVNYALRALRVPAGDHRIEFTFKPQLPSLYRILTFSGALLIFLGFLGVTGWRGYQWLQEEEVYEEKANMKEKGRKMVKKQRRKRRL